MTLLITTLTTLWRTFSVAEIKTVYDYTPPGSVLRKFVVDFVVNTSHPDYEDKDEGIFSETKAEDWPGEFLFEVARGFTMRGAGCERWTEETLGGSDWCGYHVHGDGVRCPTES